LFERILDTYTGWRGRKQNPGRQGVMDHHSGTLPKAADADRSSPENRKEG
jgi:hypothetical protein